jgi:uncharacterized protein RhaS with RHS repeats
MGFSLTNAFKEPRVQPASASFAGRMKDPKDMGLPFYGIILSTKYWDVDTKLAYYGFRYFSPGMGRWMSRDPIGELAEFNN